MSFAIFRAQKLKSAVAVRSSLKHSYREQETLNADPAEVENNVVLVGANNSAEAMRDFRKKLPEKIRKNAVQCVEILITASSEAMLNKTREEQIAYFQDSLDWIGERFGGKQNIINAGVHFDEKTPHMYVYVVPLDEREKLNCRKFMGGSKHVMTELQDDFAEKVGSKHNLIRGVKGSKAKHQTVKAYYAKLNERVEDVKFTVDDLKPKKSKADGLLGSLKLVQNVETEQAVVNRLNRQVQGLKIQAEAFEETQKKYEEVKKHVDFANSVYKFLWADLTEDQKRKMSDQAETFRKSNTDTREAERKAKLEREREERERRQAERKARRGGR